MGVPITFLDKHNPAQFEIIGTDYDVKAGLAYEAMPGIKKYVANPEWKGKLDRGYIDGKRLYSRILIRSLAARAIERIVIPKPAKAHAGLNGHPVLADGVSAKAHALASEIDL